MRTVKWADGWLPAGMHVDRLRAGVKMLREEAEKAGQRLPRSGGYASALQVFADVRFRCRDW
jgi:hypothetical protein